ncbi:centrosome and spindle pole-associated protein 1 [Trachinotus anak]|uniref:centrosome and spindle pole-associated protein 1 n=1 Tax=Trachinotus anak TaxID=443729 RepID=UPI0039F18E39
MQIESVAGDTVNMPPASTAQGISPNLDRGLGFSVLLGTDYERRKQKLQQELQQDYKHYVAKKKDLKTREPHPQSHGLSLPIDEKVSAKEKLREERNKEYNLFLQEKAQIRRLKRGAPPVTSKPGQVQASDAVGISSPASHLPILNTHTNIPPSCRERPACRRDAATLTAAVDNGKSTGTSKPGFWGRRRWQLYRPKEPYSSGEEPITDKEEELEFRHRRRKHRHTPEPVYKEKRRVREHRVDRAPLDIKEVEAPGVHDQNNNDWLQKSNLQVPESMRMAARSRPASSKNKAESATGLLIGATEEQTASRLRKEQYMQELREQIAEQRRNKMREKTLELRVAATGATDPEKEPDRLMQFGTINRQYNSCIQDVPYKLGIDLQTIGKDLNPRPKDNKPTEDKERRGTSGKFRVDDNTAVSQLAGNTMPGSGTGAAQGVPSLDYFNEDYHRNFSNMLGEAIPRVPAVPPPIPPTVTNNYKTPYDAAYYYYGTRNPLDPNLPHYQNDLPEWVQQSGNIQSPPQKPPPLIPSHCTEAAGQYRASPLDVGEFPVDKSKQRRENALSYQEALRQQIKERAERKRREKEEKERYDAKIEAEMKAYNPWGRSGGGAPIKDQNGNPFHDLNQRNKINKESYRNPVFKNSEQTQNNLIRNGETPGVEANTPPPSHQLSDFNDQTTQQQLHMQNRYREALEQQIEENKRKQAEERERIRIEEEKEERRLAEQRARIQREYEKEEQRKQKRIEHSLENKSWINGPKTYGQDEKKKRRQEQEIEKKVPESTRNREEKNVQLSYEREPSPPVPALQKRQTNLVASSPPSVVSQLSSRTERSVSAPHYQPVPVKMPQLQDGHQEVIRELSALRKYLRQEQRQLEVQLGQTDRQESHYTPPNRPRRRARVDAFESAHQTDQPSTARIYSDAARVNMQNIREFNQLKYRDTASREEVLHMYPDPPTDAQSLDIQQQALLREQRRKIRLMKREEEHDFLDQHLSHYHPRNKPGRFIHRDSILPSETAFIDVYSGDACEERVQQRSPQPSAPLAPSAQHQERTAPRRRHDYDISVNRREDANDPDPRSLQSSTSLNDEAKVRTHNQRCISKQDSHAGEHNSKPERLSGDEVDVSSLHSALERRVSVETVATEPWLRPGTSAAVKHSACRERPNRGMDPPPLLTDRAI